MTARKRASILVAMPDPAFSRLAVCVASLAMAGCAGGTETGNPSFEGQLSYTGYSSNSYVGVGAGGSQVTVDSAWFELGEVEVAQSTACSIQGGARFAIPALGLGDHAAGKHNRTIFEGRSGAFCTFLLPFAPASQADAGQAPAELAGLSLLLTGSLQDGTPFRIASQAVPRVALTGRTGGFVLDEEHARLLVAFDFATWLSEVDFSVAQRRDGQVEISSEENPELLRLFEGQLAAGVRLFADSDGDGAVDANAVPLAEDD
jgi:hypothetical protein